MKRPDFFIVGAPKSATTALFSYLKQHPDVFLPQRKEICYFCTDLHYRTPFISEEIYLSYFQQAGDKHKLIGEACVFYMLSGDAASNIKKFNPDAKIIIMLRNPVDMVYSYHSQLLANGDETIEDFNAALEAEAERRQGNLIGVSPHRKCSVEAFYYSEIAKYYEQVKRYMEIFSDKHLHIIFFEDVILSPEKVYIGVLDFLGLQHIMPKSFKIINSNKVIKNKRFQELLMNPPKLVKFFVRLLLPENSVAKIWIVSKLWKANQDFKPRPPMDKESRNKVMAYYKEDIAKLAGLLNRDLSGWLKDKGDE